MLIGYARVSKADDFPESADTSAVGVFGRQTRITASTGASRTPAVNRRLLTARLNTVSVTDA